MPNDADSQQRLTHLDADGHAHMVDVSDKATTHRVAIASATVVTTPEVVELITHNKLPKGDVAAVARIAGIMAAKQTSSLIPLCHPLEITNVSVTITTDQSAGRVNITATVKTTGKTGVEMEALTAASVAALTVYDMCKAVDRSMTILTVQLDEKDGGQSGRYERTR
ncbi:MAG: cyclic pyranopterin monophosphate synthase MoaC [Planctomycetes bacterium]|nr:cyclic pyranopterin monophosphate synthase MoaC [Planctomycetota bacterium]NOG53276.1 cyclic pyranopterin monophosphate synthase MoaC [Planctomycetota bacterium]